MEDFIASEWQFCIKLDYSESIAKSAEKIIEKAESCVEWYGNQWVAKFLPTGICILLKPGEQYDWHFDNLDYTDGVLSVPRPNRYWTEVIYLNEGTPLEVGTWSPKENRVWETEFSAPVPQDIIAKVYPKPGKIIRFPCFMVHRIVPPVENRRWTITTFVDKIKYKDFSQKDLTKGFERYFAKDTKIMYNINNVKGIN